MCSNQLSYAPVFRGFVIVPKEDMDVKHKNPGMRHFFSPLRPGAEGSGRDQKSVYRSMNSGWILEYTIFCSLYRP